jgi:hypothetical protein
MIVSSSTPSVSGRHCSIDRRRASRQTRRTEQSRQRTRPTSDPLAYELFLRGRYIWWARTNRDGTLEAARYFEQAIARDSLFSRAYAGLSDAHARLGVFGYGQPREEFASKQPLSRARAR